MAKLSRGHTFTDGSTAVAADLNTLVDSAAILPGAITEQAGATPANADSFLIYSASASDLRKCTLADVVAAFPNDAIAATKSLRSLGTTSTQAAAGNDTRFPADVTGIRKSAGGGSSDIAAVPKDFAFPPVNLAAGLSIDWDAGDIFYDTLTGSVSYAYTFANVRAGRVIQVILKTLGYTGTITWPTLLGTAPIQTNGSTVHTFTFVNSALGTIGIVKAL